MLKITAKLQKIQKCRKTLKNYEKIRKIQNNFKKMSKKIRKIQNNLKNGKKNKENTKQLQKCEKIKKMQNSLASCQKREGAMPLAAAAASCVSPTKMLLVPHLLCAPGAHAHSGTHISAARPHNFDIAAKSDIPDTEASMRSGMPQTQSAHSWPY